MKSLATIYRPSKFSDVTEQEAIKTILENQINTGEIKQSLLFTGPAGCGKTTCARIFANEINKGKGSPIEMDAASHNGVDDVRQIGKMATSQSIDGATYKTFIIDECHMLSSAGWAAFLKLIEEPPAKAVFIFCTTDAQKIPATILSRCQRYNFTKISTKAIADRLDYILSQEMTDDMTADRDAVEYIAKLANGGMRDSLTMLDKCLAYSNNLTVKGVVEALNITNYDDYIELTDNILHQKRDRLITLLDTIYASGVDFKQFLKQYVSFILDVNKALILDDLDEAFKYIDLPKTSEIETWLTTTLKDGDLTTYNRLLSHLVKLDADVKYSQNPKVDIEAGLLLFEVR